MSSRLDWAAKRQLIDEAIRQETNWKEFFAWGRAFHRAGLEATLDAGGSRDLARRAPWRRRRSVREALQGLPFEEFDRMRDLYLRVLKIDLRYHEMSAGEGYERVLEREGLVERFTDDDDVARASREAPRNTRARIRGHYIRLGTTPESVQASWGDVEIRNPFRRVPLPDPFFYRLPGGSAGIERRARGLDSSPVRRRAAEEHRLQP